MRDNSAPETRWSFLTNHAHVLACVAAEPTLRVREIAGRTGITERATQRIICDLEEAGYLARRRVGRRNHYDIAGDRPLHHPAERRIRSGPLLGVLVGTVPPPTP